MLGLIETEVVSLGLSGRRRRRVIRAPDSKDPFRRCAILSRLSLFHACEKIRACEKGRIKGEIQVREAAKPKMLQCNVRWCFVNQDQYIQLNNKSAHLRIYGWNSATTPLTATAPRENIALIICENLADRHGYLG